MVNTPDREDSGIDVPCLTCGHSGHEHVVRDVEVAGDTRRETFCEGCDRACEYVRRPER